MTEKNIMVIPARKRVGSTAAKEKIKKLRVAAHCRAPPPPAAPSSTNEDQNANHTKKKKKKKK